MFPKIAVLVVLFNILITSAFAAQVTDRDVYRDIRQFDGRVGIYAKNLNTGKVFDFNEDTVFPTASTSKLVVAMATYKYLYPGANDDQKQLYDSDVRSMIVTSDNPSFNELLDELGRNRPDALQKVVKDLRLKQTQIHSEEAFRKYQYHSVTTPYEMAKVMERIHSEKYLGREKSALLKDELANTIYNDEIPRFMLTKVMHKVGELDNTLCDVGIVDDGKDKILISAYTTTDHPDTYASDFIANMSAKLYNLLRRK